MEKIKNRRRQLIFNIVLVGVCSALNFVVMLIPKIPIPSFVGSPYIHLGNLVTVLVAIIFGGLIGGLSGAIGMGTYDLVTGYGIWTIKTIILKFGIGIVTGLTYKLIKNRNDKRLEGEMIISGSFFLIISFFTGILAFIQGGSFVLNDKTIDLPWPLYVFSFILGIILVLSGIFSHKTNMQKLMFAASIGIIFNIFGELIGGFVKQLLQGQGFKVSLALSIVSIPATVINACIVLIVVFFASPGIVKSMTKYEFEK